MGAGASAGEEQSKYTESECRKVFGELFDLPTFDVLKDADGLVSKAQVLDPRGSLREKATELGSFHLSSSAHAVPLSNVLQTEAASLVAKEMPSNHKEYDRNNGNVEEGPDEARDEEETHLTEERHAYEKKIDELEAKGRRIMLGIVDDNFDEDLISRAATVEEPDGDPGQAAGAAEAAAAAATTTTTTPLVENPANSTEHGSEPSDADLESSNGEEAALSRDWARLRKHLQAAMRTKDFALKVVSKRGILLEHASEDIRDDKDVVLAAVTQNSAALEFASSKLQEDRDVGDAAARSASRILAEEVREEATKDQIVATATREGWVPFCPTGKGFAKTPATATGASMPFSPATKKLQGDDEVASTKLQGDLSAKLDRVVSSLRANKPLVTAAVTKEGSSALRCAASELQSDKDVVSTAVRQEGRALRFASAALQGDRDVCLLAVKQDGCALYYAGDAVKEDREVCVAAVQQDFRALYYASPALRADRDVVLAAIRSGGAQGWEVLPFASRDLRSDREVILAAASANPQALKFATAALRDDPDFIKEINDARARQIAG
jgi:hypothetical protein